LSYFWVKTVLGVLLHLEIYAFRKMQGIQTIIKKRKRWRSNREKIPRRKRTQVLLQGEYHDEMALLCVLLPLYLVCLKSLVNGTRKQTKQKINFIGLQNNRHPSQHTVGNVHKASGNCQQRPR
jgi:hypothetical protein